jgi:hypothetical protein
MNNDGLLSVVNIPESEATEFDALIKEYRNKYIRKSGTVVDEVFGETDYAKELTKKKNVSEIIAKVREAAWQKFLIEEAEFNTILIRDLHKKLDTPRSIMELLIQHRITDKTGEDLTEAVREMCGEYAGRVYPYIYVLSLSNTNSRRSRAGKTFEAIIYKIYSILGYPFDSQGKVGRKMFEEVGLGKKVDSVLPSIEAFKQRRNKTIIGTMKTTLRERWQEVAEEIERTNIPEIHLLTVDESIAKSKAQEMGNHNIVIVGPQELAESEGLKDMKNIISFEEYFFEEIPQYLEFWNHEEI